MKVLLSIKPEYAEKILTGEKKYEFRKAIFKNRNVQTIVIYASSPVRKVIGEFDIDTILSLDPDALWSKTRRHSGIDKIFFDSYFSGRKVAHAIKIRKVRKYKSHLELGDFDVNHAPQSFVYI